MAKMANVTINVTTSGSPIDGRYILVIPGGGSTPEDRNDILDAIQRHFIEAWRPHVPEDAKAEHVCPLVIFDPSATHIHLLGGEEETEATGGQRYRKREKRTT